MFPPMSPYAPTPLARALTETLAERLSNEVKRLPPRISFEFFPPKTEEMELSLWGAIDRLGPLGPEFVSVTYGAGGSTRERTHRTVSRLITETGLKPAAHLTCVDASRVEVEEVIHAYKAVGVRHIVALRGDPPGGMGAKFQPRADGYNNATELTRAISEIGGFEISVGVYPELHPDSPSHDFDLEVLNQKVDAGATRGISQFFFEPETFLRYRDAVTKAGIGIKLTPGIMPVTNFKGLMGMAKACGASVPDWLPPLFAGLDQDPETRKLLAAAVAVDLILGLRAEGVDDFHFYTLNRADLVYAICRILGVREA